MLNLLLCMLYDQRNHINTLLDLALMTTPTSIDSMVQTVKQDFQKWFDIVKQKSNANNVQLKKTDTNS